MLSSGDAYVAMGSSFAAGPGLAAPAPGAPAGSGRSQRNYPHLVATELGLNLTDVTFSGATIAGLLAGETTIQGYDMPPQVNALTPATRLVTVTGGGNDVGYIARIMMGSMPAPLSWLPPIRAARRAFDTTAQTDARFIQLERGMRGLITEIRRRSPQAEIVLVEYPSLLPADAETPIGRFPRELADWARGTAARLATLTRSVGDELGCIVVPVAAASASHHAWSADPWTRRLQFSRTKGVPYHPTHAGMRAVAELVVAAIS